MAAQKRITLEDQLVVKELEQEAGHQDDAAPDAGCVWRPLRLCVN